MNQATYTAYSKFIFSILFTSLISTSIVFAQQSRTNAAHSRLTPEESLFLQKIAPDQVRKSTQWTNEQLNQFRAQRKAFQPATQSKESIVACTAKGDGCDPTCEGKLCKKAYWFWESDGWCRSQTLNAFGSKCGCSPIKPNTYQVD
jgi:hypothetical protein